jgi:hypothetical protein
VLAQSVASVRNKLIRNILWCGFSRMIITKQAGVSLAMDLSHSRPHRKFSTAPQEPFEQFIRSVDCVVDNCIDKSWSPRGPSTHVRQGDARRLPIANNSIDLVLTSPPYLNAIDYFRCSKFSLVWMGYQIGQLRELRAQSVGTERGGRCRAEDMDSIIKVMRLAPLLSPRNMAILRRYVRDMRTSVKEVARVLKPGARAVYVVGENTVRGTFVRNATATSIVAKSVGLTEIRRRTRRLPGNRRYLPPPADMGQDAFDSRMTREVVMTFEKPR